MALYQDAAVVAKTTHGSFDTIYQPGNTAAHSGIYRCVGCGKEISHNANVSLPPQNHHQHTTAQGTVRWRMVVYAQTDN